MCIATSSSSTRANNGNSSPRRIAIIGPESTGKSKMAQQLAAHYQTEWVPEFARFYLNQLDRPYEQFDLLKIAKGQLNWENEKVGHANKLLFCDTNLIVIKIWSDHKYGVTDPWIEQQLKAQTYAFYLLGNIDLAWTYDLQREHPTTRHYFFSCYRQYVEDHQLPYFIVSGIGDERRKNALKALENWLAKH